MSENADTTGILKISETAEKHIKAVSAKLHLQIAGENFVYGNAALEKSVEVKSLVDDLNQIGISGENVMVKDVTVQTETGFFNKSSKGIYKIAVHVKDLELMPSALGAIAEQKNCRLTLTEWIYDEDEARIELARAALVKAKRKADSMADAVGYKIVGIKTCSDVYNELLKSPSLSTDTERLMKAQVNTFAAPTDIGTQFQNENKVSAQVFVEFIITKNE